MYPQFALFDTIWRVERSPTHLPIQLVAVDLDGTLLNDLKKVSDRTALALRCLPERGVKVVIASARPPRSVRHIYKLLHLDTLQINYNGALIWMNRRSGRCFIGPCRGMLWPSWWQWRGRILKG